MIRARTRGDGLARADDRLLVQAFQAGEEACYEEIHRRYRPLVARVCRRMLLDPHDAEEAVQDTFLRVYQALPRFNGRYLLRAWVARIATNTCLDAIRRRARNPERPDNFEHEALGGRQPVAGNRHPDPLEIVVRDQEGSAVLETLHGLPPHHRAALVLREFEGMGHEEIAAILDTTPKRAKALIHRAKARFRRDWRGRGAASLLPLPWLRRLFRSGGRPRAAPAHPPPASVGNAIAATAAGAHPVLGAGAERLTALVAAAVLSAAPAVVATSVGMEPGPASGPPPAAAGSIDHPPAAPPTDVVRSETGDQTLAVAHDPRSGKLSASARLRVRRPNRSPAPVTPSPSPSSPAAPGPLDDTPAPTAPAHRALLALAPGPSGNGCCDGLALEGDRLRGTPGRRIAFRQDLTGPVRGPGGDPVWQAEITLIGRAGPTGGHMDIALALWTSNERREIAGTATLQEVHRRNGAWSYTFEADLGVEPFPEITDASPIARILRADLAWQDHGAPVLTALLLDRA